jgi:hypothetical protein
MTKFSKKGYNKNQSGGSGCLSARKRSSSPRPLKDNEFNIQINYRGPLITPELWCKFSGALRTSVGYDLTSAISTLLNDRFLSVCKSTAKITTDHNKSLNLSAMDNSIMISCDKHIPHYYVYKPNVIKLIKQTVLIGNYDHILGVLVPLEGSINLFINNGGTIEHDIMSNED